MEPDADADKEMLHSPSRANVPFDGGATVVGVSSAHPNIAEWIEDHEGYIEVGYDANTDTFARALDDGGMLWGGGRRTTGLDEGLRLLDTAIAERRNEWQWRPAGAPNNSEESMPLNSESYTLFASPLPHLLSRIKEIMTC